MSTETSKCHTSATIYQVNKRAVYCGTVPLVAGKADPEVTIEEYSTMAELYDAGWRYLPREEEYYCPVCALKLSGEAD